MHLASAAATYAQAVALAPISNEQRFPWPGPLREAGVAAGDALADCGPEAPVAVALEAASRLRGLVEGIELYQHHPYRRTLPDPPEAWRCGTSRLLDYRAAGARDDGPVVLVIPSLVNRSCVLDLHPRRSLLRWLAAQGLRPLLLDWGEPGAEEGRFDLAAYHRGRLLPAAQRATEIARGPVATLGYCMGGAFAAALAATRPELVGRLALIGAPWDFSKLRGLGAAVAALAAQEGRAALSARIAGLGEAFGAVPPDLLQALFAALDPTLALRKFRRFRDLDPDSTDAELFVAVEDWLNDGVAVSAPAARDIAADWYLDNLTAKGRWAVDGTPVDPRRIGAPTLAFCSTADRIAPLSCAEALPLAIPAAEVLRPDTGHVGMIVGSQAERDVWRPLAAFLSGRG